MGSHFMDEGSREHRTNTGAREEVEVFGAVVIDDR